MLPLIAEITVLDTLHLKLKRLVAPAAGRCWRPLGLLLGLLLGAGAARAQGTAAPLADTARVFSLQNLADLVLANHPIVRKAALLGDEARSQC